MSHLFFVSIFLIIKTSYSGSYQLVEEHKGNSFFDGFNFETHGGTFSKFVMSYNEAKQMGLVNTTSTTAYIGTDYWNKVNSSGRPAIQIGSKTNYSDGLLIVDISHMPYGCGVWPAWWLCGPNWPNNGEIDMIEGINLRTDDETSLHTGPNCYYDKSEQKIAQKNMTGSWTGNGNCTYQPGCHIVPDNTNTYGEQFNKNGGGVYAIEIDDNVGIKLWFFLHKDVPQDITNKKPIPSSWKTPYAFFPFGSFCTSNHFKSMRIIFDLYYCGWSGNDGTWKSQCQANGPAKNDDCETFVMNNPSYFQQAYWLINYLDIYQMS